MDVIVDEPGGEEEVGEGIGGTDASRLERALALAVTYRVDKWEVLTARATALVLDTRRGMDQSQARDSFTAD